MSILRTREDIRAAMRPLFAQAASIPPEAIVDRSKLYDSRPPPQNLGLSRTGVLPELIVATAARVLGAKLCAMFQTALVPATATSVDTFGALVALVTDHFDSLASSAAFLAVCEGLNRNPHDVTVQTRYEHVDAVGALTFVYRIRDLVRSRICNDDHFDFTAQQGGRLMDAKTVQRAMTIVVESFAGNTCL